MNYFENRRAVGPSSVWSYEFHRIIDGRMSSPEAMRPYEMLPIPTDLEIAHITLLVVVWASELKVYGGVVVYRGDLKRNLAHKIQLTSLGPP